MAKVVIMAKPETTIDYSAVSGEVTCFKLCGKVLYDKENNINDLEWKDKLIDLIREEGLGNTFSLYAFVHNLMEGIDHDLFERRDHAETS